jgi:hypothetical protein
MLTMASAFVRVRLPGGLAFALGALLGLQALAVHNAAHLDTGVQPQIVQGVLALVLVLTAWFSAPTSPMRRERDSGRTST